MKLRFYPRKDIALRLVQERVDVANRDLAVLNVELAKYEETQKSGIVTDPFGSKGAMLKGEIVRQEAILEREKSLSLLLESHSAPEVLVEVEI